MLERGARSERGAVLVFVAISLPVWLGFFGWILDFGNGAVHRRHLQTQADAGALAAAQQIGNLGSCISADVEQRALQYAGASEYGGTVAGVAEPIRNVPRQQPSHALVNSLDYYNQPGKTDPTYPSGLDGVGPCEAFMVDVKTTQQDVPRFMPVIPGLSFTPTLDFINAHARVRIESISKATQLLPVAVPEVAPRKAKATFIDADTGTVLASTELFEGAAQGGLGIWSNADTPLTVPIEVPHVEVRITLSGSTSLTCGDPLVECYDALSTTTGLSHIRGYVTPGAPVATPQIGDVRLTSGSCQEAHFVYSDASCTIGLTADVVSSDANLRVWAVIGGNDSELIKNGSTFSTDSAGIPVSTTAGRRDISLQYALTGCNNKNCRVTVGGAQRTYRAASTNSGPVQMVRISENGVSGTNSFPRCAGCTRDLVVTVGVQGSLGISQPSDPAVALRLTNDNRTQALDCDPAIANLKDELANGCEPDYEINTGTTCPSSVFGTPEPWDCVNVETGNATNQIPAGLNLRILGAEKPATCTAPNNWPNIGVGDPRIMQVFLVPFGSFGPNGQGAVPVTNFATFYITGWTGQGGGFANPCQGNGDDPVPGNDSGVIVGHFIKYVLPGGGEGSGEACDPDSVGTCVAVLEE